MEPPTVEVTFRNGIKDNLQLEHFHMKNMNAPIGCRYIGRLQNNPWSSVAVTGCLNQPGDNMEVTMLSNHSINSMFSVDYSGNTKALKGRSRVEGIYPVQFALCFIYTFIFRLFNVHSSL